MGTVAIEHDPVGAFSGPFKAAVESESPDLFTTVTITLPSVGTLRLATRPLGISGVGVYLDRILSASPVQEQVSERQPGLAALTTDIEISDDGEGLTWHKVVANFQSRLRGAVVVRKYGAFLDGRIIGEPDWYTDFVGKLDSWEMTEPNVWRLGFRVDDQPLRGDYPKKKITASDWPNAFHLGTGQLCRYIYGVHDATSLSGTGMVNTLRVDGVGFRYFVSAGRMGSIPRVYWDGVLKTLSTHYTLVNPLVNGYRYTLIDNVSDPGSAVVTCDVNGLTDKGNGTGTVMVGPAEILQHKLVNFIFGNWKDGDWLDPASAPLDLASFWTTNQWLLRRGHEAARFFGESLTTGMALVDEFCESFECRAWWTNEGKLAIGPLDMGINRVYFDGPWVRKSDDKGLSLPQNAQQIQDRVSVDYLYSHADGAAKFSMDVEDYRVAEESKLTRSLTWSPARAV